MSFAWSRIGSSRRLALLMLAVSLPPAVTLVWLGTRLLEQDRGLVAQRDFERRQAAAPIVARALDQTLIGVEGGIAAGAVPDGAVRFVATANGIVVAPAERAAWLPVVPRLREAGDGVFADEEARERRDPGGARDVYETASTSPDHAVRAAALMGLARLHWVARRWDAALDAYRRMESLKDVGVLGAPADLQARRWSCELLNDAKRADAARVCADLGRDAIAGKWRLDWASWQMLSEQVAAATGRPVEITSEQRRASALADALWRRRDDASGSPGNRRRVVVMDGATLTLIEHAEPGRVTTLAFEGASVDRWLRDAVAAGPGTGAAISLALNGGPVLAGQTPAAGAAAVVLSTTDTRLPWTLTVASGDTSDLVAEFAGRRRLVLTGLGILLALVAAGAFFIWRLLRRELAVARLQTEFVAAVSHEFRTPLASLRHLTELLDERDEMSPGRRKEFYGALARSGNRLQRLVESLLDFARMEDGRKTYELRDVDAGALAAQVVDEFRRSAVTTGADVTLEAAPDALPIRADAASLSTAIWNLLDNALKYLPDQRDIRIRVGRQPAGIAIAVQDRGLGIPAGEQREIFNRFVRGQQALVRGIKGTGLGLALASHIVQAHGGRIAVESAEGAGSTFTIILPAAG